MSIGNLDIGVSMRTAAAVKNSQDLRIEIKQLGKQVVATERDLQNFTLGDPSTFYLPGKAAEQATPKVTKFRAAIGKIPGSVGKAAASLTGLGGLLSAAAFVKFTHDALESVDVLDKVSRKTGIVVTQLPGLEIGAQQARVGFTSLTNAISTLGVNAVSASEGNDKLQAGFDALNLDVAKLLQMQPEQRFLALAAAIQGVKDPTLQLARAKGVLGKNAASVMAVLRDGGAELRKGARDAEEFGLAVSGPAVAGVRAANQEFDRLKLASKGLFRGIAVESAPALKEMTSLVVGLTKAMTEYRGAALTVAGGAAVGVAAGAGAGVGASGGATGYGTFKLGNWLAGGDDGWMASIGKFFGDATTQSTAYDDAKMRQRMRRVGPFVSHENEGSTALDPDQYQDLINTPGFKRKQRDEQGKRMKESLNGHAGSFLKTFLESNLGTNGAQVGAAALGGLKGARRSASMWMNFSLPGILGEAAAKGIEIRKKEREDQDRSRSSLRDRRASIIEGRGTDTFDARTVEGWKQLMSSTKTAGGDISKKQLKTAESSLTEQRRLNRSIDRMFKSSPGIQLFTMMGSG